MVRHGKHQACHHTRHPITKRPKTSATFGLGQSICTDHPSLPRVPGTQRPEQPPTRRPEGGGGNLGQGARTERAWMINGHTAAGQLRSLNHEKPPPVPVLERQPEPGARRTARTPQQQSGEAEKHVPGWHDPGQSRSAQSHFTYQYARLLYPDKDGSGNGRNNGAWCRAVLTRASELC